MLFKRLLPLALAATASAQSLLDALASQNATLSTLTGLLAAQPALLTGLSSATNITILAPNNAALAKFLSTAAGAAAATNADLLTALFTYHVLQGTYPASAFSTTPKFIHTSLTNTSYTNVTGGQVVEAVVNGTSVQIISGLLQVSTVTQANINFTGGVIHVIDTVLTIPGSDVATAQGAGLTTLASLANQLALAPVLEGTKDVTIFAPTDAAFSAISNVTATLNATQLAGILAYHVVGGVVGYSTILTNETLTTLAGANVTITVTSTGVLVNSAHVVVANVLVQNGVVHVIDSVLSPPTASSNATATTTGATTAATTATGAGSGSGTGTAKASSTSAFAGGAGQMQGGAIGVMAVMGAGAALINNL